MLNAGGVLGLVHQDIGILGTKYLQHRRIALENLKGIHQLVIVVHTALFPQNLVVPAVQRGKLHTLQFPVVEVLRVGHGIFDVGDGGLQCLDGVFVGKFPCLFPTQLPQQRRLGAWLQQRECLPPQHPLILADDRMAQAVNGTECQLCRQFIPEPGGKPFPHVLGGSHRIGHG